MKILAFDTTMQACSASLNDTDKEAGQHSVYEALERGHAEAIVPMIESVMSVGECTYQELDCIAVTLGPGAFTGVRVGVATARGLGLSLDVDVYGLSSLHVMAAGVKARADDDFLSEFDRIVIAADARRGEIYVQSFDLRCTPLCEPEAIVPEQISDYTGADKTFIAGNAGPLLEDVIPDGENQIVFGYSDLLPDAQNMGHLVISGSGLKDSLSPLYLRAPDAKPQSGKQIARTHS